jgi:hypothetical protein
VEINGVAHVVLRANRYEECIRFHDRLMAELGPQAVHRDDSFVYYVGGRTALQIRRVDPGCADPPHVEAAAGWITGADIGPRTRGGALGTGLSPAVLSRPRGESASRSITFPARGCWPRMRHVTPRRVTR